MECAPKSKRYCIMSIFLPSRSPFGNFFALRHKWRRRWSMALRFCYFHRCMNFFSWNCENIILNNHSITRDARQLERHWEYSESCVSSRDRRLASVVCYAHCTVCMKDCNRPFRSLILSRCSMVFGNVSVDRFGRTTTACSSWWFKAVFFVVPQVDGENGL